VCVDKRIREQILETDSERNILRKIAKVFVFQQVASDSQSIFTTLHFLKAEDELQGATNG